MNKCKCPYTNWDWVGDEYKQLDCLVYGETVGEHYKCDYDNDKKSDLYYKKCPFYILQSKIDKANEILNRPQFEYDNIPCNYEEDIKELKDILKEDK